MICSFCGKNADFRIIVHHLVPINKVSESSESQGIGPTYAKVNLCKKCLPFKKVRELITYETVEKIRRKDA